jgi:single-strand DNA-binding protein
MFSQTIIVGNVGSDTDMRYTPSGDAVTTFSVAVNKSWNDNSGTRQTKTTWYRVTTWRKLAEVVGMHVRKGSKVMVVGEMQPARAYLDRNGQAAASLELTANTVRFLDSKPDNGGGQGAEPATLDEVESMPF